MKPNNNENQDSKNIMINKPVNFKFSVMEKNESLLQQNVCIYKEDGQWTNELCNTKVLKSVECDCKSLNPVTIVNDLNSLFVKSSVKDIFSEKSFEYFTHKKNTHT